MPKRPEEIRIKGKMLVLPADTEVNFDREGVFILDFFRKFEDPDLNKLPARPIEIQSNAHRYLLEKYNIILGEFKDYDQS